MSFSDLLPAVNEGMPTDILFGSAEARECTTIMSTLGDIMFSEDILYKL